MRHIVIAGSLACALATAGCSSSPPLRTESSTSAIREAEVVGADAVPRAALHLQLAREELERAQALAEKGDKDQAASLLLRAEVDAELAILLSREQAERSEAALAMERVHQLQLENR